MSAGRASANCAHPSLSEFSWYGWLLAQFKKSTKTDGDVLDEALAEQKGRGLCPTMLPYQLSLFRSDQLKRVQILLVFIIATHLCLMVANTSSLLRKDVGVGESFRFSVVQHSGAADADLACIAKIGILRGSCKFEGLSMQITNNTIEVGFLHPQEMNGWYFVTKDADCFSEPIAWSVEVKPVHSEHYEFVPHHDSLSGLWSAGPQEEPGQTILTSRCTSFLQWSVASSALGVLIPSVALVFTVLKRGNHALRLLSAWNVAMFACYTTAASSISATNDPRLSLQWWQGAAVHLFLIPPTTIQTLHWTAAAHLSGAGAAASALWVLQARIGNSPHPLRLVLFLVFFVSGLLLSFFQRRNIQLFHASLAKDRLVLETAWQSVRSEFSDGSIASLQRICVEKMACRPTQRGGSVGSDRPQVRHDCSDGEEWTDVCLGFASLETQSPVSSLDQLYAQAEGCVVMLGRKMRELSRLHRGLFLARPRRQLRSDAPGRLMRLDQIEETEASSSAEFQFAELKPKHRAMEKVLCRYLGRVDCVLDVCRSMAAFESPDRLARCLEDMQTDADMEILRIRNSMSVHGASSNGFRAVVVNLRFRSEEARCLGIDGHVCEVILTMRGIAQCLSQEAHADYLRLKSKETRGSKSIAVWSKADQSSIRSPAFGRSATTPTLNDETDDSDRGVTQETMQCEVVVHIGNQTCEPAAEGKDGKAKARVKMKRADSPTLMAPPQPEESSLGAGSEEAASQATTPAARPLPHPSTGTDERETTRSVRTGRRASVVGGAVIGQPKDCVLLQEYRRRTLRLEGNVDRRREQLEEGVAQVSLSALFTTSFPLDAALRKPLFPLLLCVVGAISAAVSVTFITNMHQAAVRSAQHVRFRAVTLREEAQTSLRLQSLAAPVVEEWGVIRDGCRVPLHNWTVSHDQREYSAEVPASAAPLSGFFFVTSSRDAALDPVSFDFATLTDDGVWAVIGASRQVVWRGSYVTWEAAPRSVPTHRMQPVDVLFALPWYIVAREVGHRMLAVSFSLVLAALSLSRVVGKASWAATAAGVTALAAVSVEAIGRTVHHNYKGPFPLVWLPTAWLVVANVWFAVRSSRVLALALGYMLSVLGAAVIEDVVLLQHPQRLWSHPPLALLVSTLALCLLILSGVLLRARAHRRLRPDMDRYREVWAAVCADEGERGGIERVQNMLDERVPPTQPRPCQTTLPVETVSSLLHTLESSGRCKASVVSDEESHAVRGEEVAVKVTSLALLYRQATGLHPLAQAKVEEWAVQTGGLFPLAVAHSRTQFERAATLDSLSGRAASTGEVKWPKLKSVTRAVEKLVRSYDGQAWRLLDICRFNIVFESSADLAECVAAVLSDTHVQVLSAKNRMRHDYPAELSAGYRDVNLNLVLVSDVAAQLGVATHVWELQLALRSVAEVRSGGGHRRYVAARNARAE